MYKITYANGQTDTADTYKKAIAAVKAEWPSAVYGHEGDLSDGGNRTLCWGSFDDAALAVCNNDARKAIAVITRSDD